MPTERTAPDPQYALTLAEQGWGGEAKVREELVRVTLALEQGPHLAAFARCCLGLARLAAIDKDPKRAASWLDRGLSAATLEACPAEWLKLLNFRGYFFLVEGLLVEALGPLLSVVRRAPEVPGAEGECAQAYGNLGATLSMLGDVPGSIEMLRQSQAYAARLNIASQAVQVGISLCLEELYRGERLAAEAALAGALATHEERAADQPARTQRRMQACLLRGQAGVETLWGDAQLGFQLSERAIEALAEWEDPEEIAACLEFKARALWKLGRAEEAWQAVLDGLKLAALVPGGRLHGRMLSLGGDLAESRGDIKGMRLLLSGGLTSETASRWSSLGGMVRKVIERNLAETELRQADLNNSVQALRRSNEELVQAKEVAERVVAQRRQFLAHMSHELRTPLHGVMGTAELLLETALSEEQAELVGIVQRSSELTLAVVDDILDLGKLEAKGLTLDSEVFLLRRPLQDVLANLRGRAKDTVLALDVDEGLPEAVHGDPRRLQQVLMNLVGNALKFTRSGRVRVSLHTLDQDRVRFEVQDDGLGIPEERLGDLFDPYVQGEQVRGVGGTGLGLAICKGIVEGYGGRIGVDSELGVGSTFWFEIPLPAARMAGHLQAQAGGGLEGLCVLLAEDNPVNRMLMERQLLALGARVLLAEDGESAVARAMAHQPDLILMDMHMPKMDGIQATQALRKAAYSGPIVALTASVMDEDRGACLASGMDGFLTKPLGRERLLKAARALLSRAA